MTIPSGSGRRPWRPAPASRSSSPSKSQRPENLSWAEILASLKNQAYVRMLAARSLDADLALHRVEDLLADPGALSGAGRIFVVQDRIQVEPAAMARFTEAVETAMHFGRGEVRIFSAAGFAELGHYSRGLHSPKTGRKFRAATPALFSFNSPLGACPVCRGFGRVIDIDYRLAIPDPSLSIDDGAIRCWEGAVYSASKDDLRVFTKRMGIRTDLPFRQLTAQQQAFVIEGEPGYGAENGKEWPKYWYGVEGVFPLAGEEHLQDARAGLPFALPLLQPVPGLRRDPAAARSALLEMARAHAARALPAAGRPAARRWLAPRSRPAGARPAELAQESILDPPALPERGRASAT